MQQRHHSVSIEFEREIEEKMYRKVAAVTSSLASRLFFILFPVLLCVLEVERDTPEKNRRQARLLAMGKESIVYF